MRRGCIRPPLVKAIGGRSLTPSDTGAMPRKSTQVPVLRGKPEPQKPTGFEVIRHIFLLTRVGEEPPTVVSSTVVTSLALKDTHVVPAGGFFGIVRLCGRYDLLSVSIECSINHTILRSSADDAEAETGG